jgi:hypothetical protein
MLNVTLDNNCIIDLEQNRPAASDIKRLIQMHMKGKINLRVVAISASERKPDDTYVSQFDEFKERIAAVGLGDVEILPTIAYTGLAFVGYCLVGGGVLTELERKVQRILFPTIELAYADFCKKRGLDLDNKKAWGKWVNAKCDVLTLWSHIWHHGDIFVTGDKDFHKETAKPRLIALDSGKILRPVEAIGFLVNGE